MLEGMSGERISLSMEQNGHLLCLGKAGSGKSFYLYRRLEELWQNGTGGRRHAVLDYSGSFTLSDIDLKNRKINVDHQLQRTRRMQYVIEDTPVQLLAAMECRFLSAYAV